MREISRGWRMFLDFLYYVFIVALLLATLMMAISCTYRGVDLDKAYEVQERFQAAAVYHLEEDCFLAVSSPDAVIRVCVGQDENGKSVPEARKLTRIYLKK